MTSSAKIRVLVVDDHAFLRTCLVSLIRASADLDPVGECGDGHQVLTAVTQLAPDVVLLDVRLGGTTGYEVLAELHRAHPGVHVIMLSSDASAAGRRRARLGGSRGYLIKGTDGDLVLDAIRRAAAGGTLWAEDTFRSDGAEDDSALPR